MQATVARLEGAYALGVVSEQESNTLIGARRGSPLVLGVGIEEHFIASDQMALRQVTDRFIFLQEGDLLKSADRHLQSITPEDSAKTEPFKNWKRVTRLLAKVLTDNLCKKRFLSSLRY